MRRIFILVVLISAFLQAFGQEPVAANKYGFSFETPKGWILTEEFDSINNTTSLLLGADTTYKPGIVITPAFELSILALGDTIANARVFADYYLSNMEISIDGFKATAPIAKVEIGGKSAYKIEAVFTNYGVEEHVVCFVFDIKKGVVQSINFVDFESKYNSNKPVFDAFLNCIKFN
jgi:hypothetical protein